jgi:hypothetical protein
VETAGRERGAALDLTGRARVVRSQARLLGEPTQPLLIPEEEVPREGAVVRRAWQGARWYDGRLFVWSANRKSAGRGEGSSGLRFDTLREWGSTIGRRQKPVAGHGGAVERLRSSLHEAQHVRRRLENRRRRSARRVLRARRFQTPAAESAGFDLARDMFVA